VVNKLKKFWNFKAASESIGELMLYGDISSSSWWGDEVTPKQFKEDLDALGDISELNIYINSGGGDVFAGQSIHSMLKRHSATKTVYIDGLAASIASVIAMAGDKIIMPRNAMMMIHKCWTLAIGNADDMRKMAEDMDKIDESIVAAYEQKTGKDAKKIKKMMEKETWMTAEDALADGFADEIEESKQLAASLNGGFLMLNNQQFDLKKYKNAPKMVFLSGETPKKDELPPKPETPMEPANLDPPALPPNPEPVVSRQAPVDVYQKQILINRRKSNA
jgi:ATP-dependent Clp protease protease subunit